MRFFDHFGHLTHGHAAAAWLAIFVGVFVALAMSLWAGWAGFSSRKDTDS